MEQKIDLSNKTCLFYDNGLFIELAIKLSKSFGKVYYYNPWKSGFPKRNLAQVSMGIPGIENVLNFFDYVDQADLIVFPDVYDGDLQNFLVSKGYNVFGAKKGEDLELNRDGMKRLMKRLNLPVNNYEVVKGVPALRDYLKEHKNVYVKINMYRGNFETFRSNDYKLVEPVLDQIEHDMGPMKYVQEFVVEDAIDNAIEVGYDGYCIDGLFPTKGICGIEIKDLGYIGKFMDYKDMSPIITGFNSKMSSTLKKYEYRGFMSSELRITEDDKKPYMIDFCARAGSPPNEVYQEVYTNLAEICWFGAQGICIDPIVEHKYALEVLIHSSWADKNWQPIYFPNKYRDNLKFRNLTIINGVYYAVPQSVGLPEIGAVVAIGDSIDEVVDKIKEVAEQVEGYYIEIPLQSIDTAIEEATKIEKLGIKIL
jgi:hypothetical protein